MKVCPVTERESNQINEIMLQRQIKTHRVAEGVCALLLLLAEMTAVSRLTTQDSKVIKTCAQRNGSLPVIL
jgi:hypothetical protein